MEEGGDKNYRFESPMTLRSSSINAFSFLDPNFFGAHVCKWLSSTNPWICFVCPCIARSCSKISGQYVSSSIMDSNFLLSPFNLFIAAIAFFLWSGSIHIRGRGYGYIIGILAEGQEARLYFR